MIQDMINSDNMNSTESTIYRDDEICKYSTKGKQKDNDANEVQKHLQLYDLSMGEYVTDKYVLWLDFRMIDENVLHATSRVIKGGGITPANREESRNGWSTQCICLPHYGCPVEHSEWSIHFCHAPGKCYE